MKKQLTSKSIVTRKNAIDISGYTDAKTKNAHDLAERERLSEIPMQEKGTGLLVFPVPTAKGFSHFVDLP